LIFSQEKKYLQKLLELSNKCEHAIIFAYFNNTDEIANHLHYIDKYEYILRKGKGKVTIERHYKIRKRSKNSVMLSIEQSKNYVLAIMI